MMYDIQFDVYADPVWRITHIVLLSTFVIIGTVGNVLVLTLIIAVPKMHSAVNICLASLAVTDLLVLVYYTLVYLLDLQYTSFLCTLDNFGFRAPFICSVLTFLLIGVERYTMLCRPLKSMGMWTYRKVFLLLAGIWIVSIGISVPHHVIHEYEEFEIRNKTVSNCFKDVSWIYDYDCTIYVIFIFFPVLATMVLYGKIIFDLKKRPYKADTRGDTVTNMNKSRSRVVLMLVVLVIILAVCVLPFKIFTIIIQYKGISREEFYKFWLCFQTVESINHAVNPIVYFIMSQNFREAFRVICTCSRATQRMHAV